MSTAYTLMLALGLLTDASSDIRLEHGFHLLEEGKLAAAENAFRDAAKYLDKPGEAPSPELVVALNNLGTTLASRHLFERALPVLRRAQALATQASLPPEAQAQISGNLAQVLLRLGSHADAGRILDQVIQYTADVRSPYRAYALLFRAELELDRQEWDRAMRDIDAAEMHGLALDASVHHLRGILYLSTGRPAAAARELGEAVTIARTRPDWTESPSSDCLLAAYRDALRKSGRRKLAKTIQQELRQRARTQF